MVFRTVEDFDALRYSWVPIESDRWQPMCVLACNQCKATSEPTGYLDGKGCGPVTLPCGPLCPTMIERKHLIYRLRIQEAAKHPAAKPCEQCGSRTFVNMPDRAAKECVGCGVAVHWHLWGQGYEVDRAAAPWTTAPVAVQEQAVIAHLVERARIDQHIGKTADLESVRAAARERAVVTRAAIAVLRRRP